MNGEIKEVVQLSNGTEIIIKSMTIVEELDAMERKAYYDGIKREYAKQKKRQKEEYKKRIRKNPLLRFAAWCGIMYINL